MASTEPPQPVKHKTCVLRVSIHCEGCKRKVNKILQSVPGVHSIEIERQNHRVVVTGDVSPESLVRKLVKSGKHAELWPENPPQNHGRRSEKVSGNGEVAISGNQLKPPANKPETPAVEIAVAGKEIKPPATKTEAPAVDSSKSSDPVARSGVGNGGGKADEDFGGKKAVEVKTEEKKPETGPESDAASPPVVEQKEKQTGNDVVAGGGGGGSGGEEKKKKKKKRQKESEGQNGNLNTIGETTSSSAPPPQATTTRSSNQSPPRQHEYKYPAPYPHAPVYTVSYNTAHPPVNSYTASYYAAAPPQSYAYSHYGSPPQPPSPPPLSVPSDYYESYTQQPVDSFEMFSDENPNGCEIM